MTSVAPSRSPSPRPPASIEATRLAFPGKNLRLQPEPGCVPHLVSLRAAETPDAPALSTSGQMLTYAELNTLANQIAHYLISLGAGGENAVGSDPLVGLCLDRSLVSVVSTLAVLKAGAAYFPLDPAYPVEGRFAKVG